eukprot:6808989-Prymnesium_polylepis.1
MRSTRRHQQRIAKARGNVIPHELVCKEAELRSRCTQEAELRSRARVRLALQICRTDAYQSQSKPIVRVPQPSLRGAQLRPLACALDCSA